MTHRTKPASQRSIEAARRRLADAIKLANRLELGRRVLEGRTVDHVAARWTVHPGEVRTAVRLARFEAAGYLASGSGAMTYRVACHRIANIPDRIHRAIIPADCPSKPSRTAHGPPRLARATRPLAFKGRPVAASTGSKHPARRLVG